MVYLPYYGTPARHQNIHKVLFPSIGGTMREQRFAVGVIPVDDKLAIKAQP